MTQTPSQPKPIIPPTDPTDDPGRALSQREIVGAATIIMFAYVLSGALGLIRQMVLAALFGADRELDAFYAALRVPETLFALIAGGALGSAFIPVFSGYLSRDDFKGAWRLASTILTLVTLIATVIAAIVFLLATPIVKNILIPSSDAQTQTLTIELMRIMLVTVVLFGISGLLMGILNSYQRFTAPALTPSMYNIGIILGTIILSGSMGIRGAAWGTVLGAMLHMAIQIPFVYRLPFFSFKPAASLKTEGVTEVLKLMGPRLLGLGVVQINFWVNFILASAMGIGSIAALQTAYTLMFTILGILGQSLGTAVFPTLSTQFAKGDHEGFQRTFSGALRNVLFLSIPAGLGMAILSKPIVGILFERGEWTSVGTSATAWALLFYSIGLMGHTALEILVRTFYALHNTWTPVIIGGIVMILNIILSVIFVVIFEALGADTLARGPYAGLALANSLATALESTVLWILLRRRIPTLDPRPVLHTLTRTLIAGIGMVAVVGAWLLITADLPQILRLFGGLVLGIGSFWGIAVAVHIDEAQSVPRQILARFSKS